MKKLLSLIAVILCVQIAHAQITITAADMPVSGDTLRYSNANAFGTAIDPADSGANFNWNYDLTSTSQGVDTFKKAATVNFVYGLTISLSAYGYKVADSIPGIGMLVPGITIQNVYTFFEKITSPPAYVAAAFAASISGFPVASNYTDPDAWYIFPLNYGNTDSTNFALHISLASAGSLKQAGYRLTKADGWGTITTPYFPTPVNCIRVRSEIHEIDSISFGTTTFGIPRVSVEYKWLVNGEHYPALWVTSNMVGGTEIISGVKYRDNYIPVAGPSEAVHNTATHNSNVTVYPNPAANGMVTLNLPDGWNTFQADVYDVQSRLLGSFKNNRQLDLRALPSGHYVIRVISGTGIAFVPLEK